MIDALDTLSGRAAELRRAFDQSFAEPAAAASGATVDFVTVRLGDDPYALRLREIAGLYFDLKVTPCPGPIREMRGLAGFRGAILPVYDLPAMVGYPLAGTRSWLVTVAATPLALAFDLFEGHIRLPPDAIAAAREGKAGTYVSQVARHEGFTWPVVDIPAVVAAIRARATPASSKEY